MLVKLKNTPAQKAALKELSEKYQVRVLEETPKTLIVESTESGENTKKLFEALNKLGIDEIAQTGIVALSKKS